MVWARYGLKGVGFLLVCLSVWVSASMNWNFGFSLGHSELEGWMYGVASLLPDLLKMTLPFFLLWLVSKGREVWGSKDKSFWDAVIFILILFVLSQSLMLWFVTIGYSLSAFWGFSAIEPAPTLDNRPQIPFAVLVVIGLFIETVATVGLFALIGNKGAEVCGTFSRRKSM